MSELTSISGANVPCCLDQVNVAGYELKLQRRDTVEPIAACVNRESMICAGTSTESSYSFLNGVPSGKYEMQL